MKQTLTSIIAYLKALNLSFCSGIPFKRRDGHFIKSMTFLYQEERIYIYCSNSCGGKLNENVFKLHCHSYCSSKFYPCIHIFS